MKNFITSTRSFSKSLVVLLMIFANFTSTPGLLTVTALDGPTIIEYPNPGSVVLGKTESELGDGFYEITLELSGIPLVTSSDIVLVMDISGSMEGDKIDAAKDAAKDFVDAIIAKNQGHRIAIVTFANQPVLVSGFSTNATVLKTSIDAMDSDGGTHLEGGIHIATELLSSSGLPTNNHVIVVLGDGQPTFGYDFNPEYIGPLQYSTRNGACRVTVSDPDQDNNLNFSGRFDFNYPDRIGEGNSIYFNKEITGNGTCPTGGEDDFHFEKEFSLEDSVYWHADQAKDFGISIFSIGLEVNSTGDRILSSIQNSGYYDADSDDLSGVYDAIASQIIYAARNAVVTDKIGDDFEFVEISDGFEMLDASYDAVSRILTWNVGNVGSAPIILKYVISIHSGLPNGEYPTNEYATVDYTNIYDEQNDETFPQPTVIISNLIPVALDDSFSVLEGGTKDGAVSGTDPESDPLTYIVVDGPTRGSLIMSTTGTFQYIHDGSELSSDSFTFKVNDGSFDSNIATVSITVNPVNDAPVAIDEYLTVLEGATFPLLPGVAQLDATDNDNLLSELIFTILDEPDFGTVIINPNGTFIYTHDGSESTIDSFTFTVSDGDKSDIGSAYITISAEVDGPDAIDENIIVDEGGSYPILPVIAQLDATDPDTLFGDLIFVKLTNPAHGIAVVNEDGSFTYIHDGSETLSDSFTFTVSDGSLSDTATVIITIDPVNDPPVVTDDSFTVLEGGTKQGQLAAVDPDDTVFTFATVITTAHGSLVVFPGGDYTYIHDGSETTSDSFTYQANDGEALSNIATITITITPVNDGPTAIDKYFNVAEGATYPVLPTLDYVTATDPDTLLSALTYSITSDPSNGSVVINPDGSFVYTHDGSETSSDYFTFTVSDGEFSDVGAVYVTVTAGNDAPVALPQTITVLEGGTYPLLPPLPQLGATDADTPSMLLSFVLSTPAAHGLVTVYPDGTFTYVHDGTENFSDSFIFTVSDEGFLSSSATVTINVTPVNDPPVVEDEYFSVDEGGTLLEQLVGLDPDDVDLDFEWVTLPSNGSLVVDLDGSITYIHFGDENIFDSFTYRAYDGEAWSNIATVYITVNPVNDPPVAYPDRFTVLEDGIHNGWLMATDPDFGFFPVGLDTMFVPFGLSFVIVQEPQFGTVIFTSPFGDYQYDHDGTENFTDFFTYQVYDGEAWSNIARVDITITPVNDPPVVTDEYFNVDEAGTLLEQLGATDPDDIDHDFEWVTLPANGSLVVNLDGSFTYIHNGSETTSDSFTYKAYDGEAYSNIATVYITVNPVNDPPVANDDGFTVLEGGVHNGQLTGTDPDTLEAEWTYALVTTVVNGTLVLNPDGSYIYTHNGSETTTDSFTFNISDGALLSNTATITIDVTPVNDPPVATGLAFTLLQGTLRLGTLSATDLDDTLLTYALVTGPVHGTVIINADGTFSYQHAGVTALPDAFTFNVYDGEVYSNTATVSITVTPLPPVNTAPTALPEAFTVVEGGSIDGLVAGNDADGDPILFFLTEDVKNGTLTFAANGAYTYTHNNTETTSDSFKFRVWDGKAYSAVQTATVTVTPVNDAPVAVNGTDETDFNTALTGNIHGLASDIDSADWTLVVVSTTTHGTLVLNANGSFTYTPNDDFSGIDVFSFKANDGSLDSNVANYTITVNEDVIIIEPETPLSPLSFWWAYLLGLLLLLLFFLRPNLKYALVDKNGNEKVIRRHIFANGKDDLFIDLNDKKVEGLVAVDLVVYKQLVKREQGHKITFNLFKKPMKTISVPEDMKEKIEDQIKL